MSTRSEEILEQLLEIATFWYEKETKKKKSKAKTEGRREIFIPPTLAEVKEQIREKRCSVDAESFIAYYEARGWTLNNGNKVANWKACIVTWSKNGFGSGPPSVLSQDKYL